MSQELTLKLSEGVFTAIQLQAQTIGIAPERLAATLLERQVAQALKLFLDETEQNAARARFERECARTPEPRWNIRVRRT